jgi:flagellar protein FliS
LSNPYQLYRATAVTTASPLELVLMLYQGVLRFVQRAVQAVERGDVNEAHASFVRAQDIIAELVGSLDLEAGGEVARNLVGIYDYAYRRLVDANCRKATGPALEVVQLFRALLPAWQAMADGPRGDLADDDAPAPRAVGR